MRSGTNEYTLENQDQFMAERVDNLHYVKISSFSTAKVFFSVLQF